MLTLTTLSTIIGGILGILPRLIEAWQQKRQYDYQLALAQLQYASNYQTLELQKEIAAINQQAQSEQSIHNYDDGRAVADDFFSQLRASVRPVITYTFFFMFVLAKITVAVGLFRSGLNITDVSLNIFDETSMTFFGTIMGFWFGTRGVEIAKGTPTRG